MAADWLTTAQAAEVLGVGEERVRQLCRSGELVAGKVRSGPEWQVDAASVAERANSVARPRRPRSPATGGPSLDELVAAVARRLGTSSEDAILRDVERERDRYRSDAAAVRESALHLTRAVTEVRAGMTALLDAMDEQAEALAALLAPGGVADLLPTDA